MLPMKQQHLELKLFDRVILDAVCSSLNSLPVTNDIGQHLHSKLNTALMLFLACLLFGQLFPVPGEPNDTSKSFCLSSRLEIGDW